MPTPPPVPGVLKVLFRQSLGVDLDVITRLMFSYTGTAPTDATCLLLAEQFWTAYSNYLTPLMQVGGSLTGCDVIDLSSDTAGSAVFTSPSAGSRSGSPLPGGAAALQNFRIARRYRGGKPRAYWPFGTASDLTDQQDWNGTFLANWVTQWDLFIAACLAIVEAGCSISAHVNVSLYKGFATAFNPITGRTRNPPTYRAVALAPDAILTAPLNPKVASQRRRNLHSV